jgi:hypothetical protein
MSEANNIQGITKTISSVDRVYKKGGTFSNANNKKKFRKVKKSRV